MPETTDALTAANDDHDETDVTGDGPHESSDVLAGLSDTLDKLSDVQRELVLAEMLRSTRVLAAHAEQFDDLEGDQVRALTAASTNTAVFLLDALQEGNLYSRLPRDRRAPVTRALERVAELLSEAAHQRSFTDEAVEAQAQAAVDTFTVLVRGGRRQLQSVIDALEPVPPDDPTLIDLEEAEARGRLRLQALYQKLMRESYSVQQLREQWRVSRQRLKQLRDQDRLFALEVPFAKGLLYPHWQFADTGRPRSVLPQLIQVARESRLDAISFHQLMTSPTAGDGERSPVDLLDAGREDLVLGILRAAR